ncbi:MAG TPA: DUF2490 domain-containing protein [Pyrinomonadaceae bacterium]|nr:DUF2490 domain-containing protein [Pyrinomonadaceae bacterium]
MIRTLFCVLCASLWLTSTIAAQPALDQTDNQVWSEVQLVVPVTNQFDFNLIGGLRVGRDISHPVDERIGAGFTYRHGKYVSVAPHYLHIGMQPFAGRRIWENRLVLPVTLQFKLGKFTVRDRNQVEWRYRSSGVKSTRFRNRLLFEHPLGPARLGLSFSIGDEVFYDWMVDRWVRNRFAAGITKVFNKHFTQDVYYLRQNDGVSLPGDLNVIGTSLRFRL